MLPRHRVHFVVVVLAIVSCASAFAANHAPDDEKVDDGGRAAVRQRLVKAAESPKFKAAVKQLQKLVGSDPKPLETAADGDATGGVIFTLPHKKAEELLAGPTRKQMLAQGAYFFRYQNMHGLALGGQETPDMVALLPTTSGYDVLLAVETEGANSGVYSGQVVKWLKELEKTQPFELTEAGEKYMAAKFTKPVTDPDALAAKVFKLCRDFDSGEGEAAALKKITEGLKKGNLFLFWT